MPPPPPHIEEVPPTNNALNVLLNAVVVARPAPTYTINKNRCSPSTVDVGPESDCGGSSQRVEPFTPAYNRACPLKDKASYLKASQSALKLWRDSLSLPFYMPAIVYGESLPPSQSRVWPNRVFLSDAARIQARADWQRGDNDAALDWLLLSHKAVCREAVSFYNGRNHPRGYFAQRGTTKRRGVVLDDLERLMPLLNAAQLRQGARGLEENRKLLPSLVEAINVTKSFVLARDYQCLARNDLRLAESRTHPELVDMSQGEQLMFRWTNKKAAWKRLGNQFEWIVAQAKMSAIKRYDGSTQGRDQLPEDAISDSTDVLHRMALTYTSVQYFSKIESVDAREVVLLSAMAARAFALEHGRNPRSLSELVPRYLSKVETDPFAPAQPLRYSPTPRTYIEVSYGKPIYTLPLPPNASPAVPGPPGSPSGSAIKGYAQERISRTLPFLLYSVGPDGKDGGEIILPSSPPVPSSPSENVTAAVDDVLAPARLFAIPSAQEETEVLLPPAR